MKALVLAGGSGTRLRPITYTSAKQLVPLANEPIIAYGLRAIAATGITEVGVVVGDTADDIEAFVGDGSAFGIRVTYIRQDRPGGLAHAVLISRAFLEGSPFVMYLGDNLVVDGINSVVEDFQAHRPAALVLLKQVENPSQFGVAELDPNGQLIRLVEKPANPPSNLALVGVYLFDDRIHEAVRSIEPSARGELEITDAIQWLIDSGAPVRSNELQGPWVDTGKLTDLLEANAIVLGRANADVRGSIDDKSALHGSVVVSEGATIRNSVVNGPVAIGAGACIDSCTIGPDVAVGKEAMLLESTVARSLILEGAQLDRAVIRNSLVGRFAKVRGDGSTCIEVHLGDHAFVTAATDAETKTEAFGD